MLAPSSRSGLFLGLALAAASAAGACAATSKSNPNGFSGSTGGSGTGNQGGSDGGTVNQGGHGGTVNQGGNGGGDSGLNLSGTGGVCTGFDVPEPALTTITVDAGTMTPQVPFSATLNCKPVAAAWGVDLGNVGSVLPGPATTTAFTPTGTAGGLVTVTAGLNAQTVTRQVFVKLTATQNGPNGSPGETAQIPTSTSQFTNGGGVGGVGGEGLGSNVTDPSTLAALAAPAGDGTMQGLSFLYPYDQTVWPRGMLAPLLMWSWSPGDADAIRLDITTTTGSFTYSGIFGRPAILAGTDKFIRMPIPQDVWDMATNTAGGSADRITVSLTVAKDEIAYGPISETWTVAPTHLSGTIYYNSYGTQLAQNYSGAVGGNGNFGGAVLSIHVGDTGPKLAAGFSGSTAGCRVCHSEAADGSRLIVQHGDSSNFATSSAYDIAPTGYTEHVLTHSADYPAMYPDGSLALTETGLLLPLPTDTTAIPTTGLTTVVTDLGRPAFSPDGTMLVFNPLAGPAPLQINQTLYVMSFDKASSSFGPPMLIASDLLSPAAVRPGWPAFFPDSKSVVYHHETVNSVCRSDAAGLVTRSGSRAQIYWTNLTGPAAATPLDQLNGKGYLPKLATPSTLACNDSCGTPPNQVGYGAAAGLPNLDHSDDVNTNYEPTVAPIAAGGYAWVVFTSRRMYGNVATIGSFCSDPRGVDLIDNITPKKLWVAAVDLTQAPGVDGSHPAFYLPGQEILAGNARGFWTLDPCQADGASCQAGDQCCNGYCEPTGDAGALMCTSTPPMNSCSAIGDKCTTAASCCDMTNVCINGFCAVQMPQ